MAPKGSSLIMARQGRPDNFLLNRRNRGTVYSDCQKRRTPIDEADGGTTTGALAKKARR